MYAQNADELRQLICDHPKESPSVFIADNTFAAYCYDHRTIPELISAFHRDADPQDCRAWNLSPAEWKENIEMALVALKAIQNKPC